MISDSVLTVSQLNTYVKLMFDSDIRLNRVVLVGEISNFVNHYKTGHCYFSLKDSQSAIKAVMFSANAKNLKFTVENGLRVFVTGRVSVFERDGVYQLYAEKMEPEGAGALMLAFEQLKKRLTLEGVFDDSLKKPVPHYPERIAVVTSPVGAAVRDVINVISRRYPLAEIIMCPVAAQGVSCAAENIKMLKSINASAAVDVIILCRGGGAIEDLWGYNDEALVRTVAASKIPVISGIGHETDFTLCDFAADLRAPTPSAAAELAVPDILELYQLTASLSFRCDSALERIFNSFSSKNENLKLRLSPFDPKKILESRSSEVLLMQNRADNALKTYLDRNDAQITVMLEKLKLLNPYEILKKGFIPVFSEKKKIVSVSELSKGDSIKLEFADGTVLCSVDEIIMTEI